MKSVLVPAAVCVILLAAGCSQSPEKLLATADKYHANKKYDEASILYQKVLSKDKTNAEAYYRLGLNFLDQHKYREAAGALRRAIDLKPSNIDAEAKLSELYWASYVQTQKRDKGARNDLNDLVAKMFKQDPNSFDGYRFQGLLALADHDMAKAEDSFAKANRVKPYSRNLVGLYAATLIDAGKTDEGIALVNETLKRDKTWAEGYDFLFLQYQRTGQRDKADAALKANMENDPKSERAIQVYASYRLANGDFPGAEKLMLGMLNDPKSFPTARLLIGDFYMRAKKPDEALAAFQQGAKDDPKNAVKYEEQIVKVQAATKHPDQALSMAKDLADKNPKDASAAQMYAMLILETTPRASALKAADSIKKLVDNNPADTTLRLDLARAYFAANERDKALAAAQQIIGDEQKTRTPNGRVVVPAQTLAARIYGDRGDNQKALEQSTLVLGERPGDPEATVIKDRALIALGQPDKAEPDLLALVKQYPAMSEAHVQLGTAYLGEHQFDKAAEQFDAAWKGNPPDARGFLGLQSVKLMTGHSAEAVQALQDLVSKNPADASARFELANFEATAAGIPGNQANGKQLLQQAADNYKEILKSNQSADLWLRLGLVQQALQQTDAALASFEQSSKTDPKNGEALLSEAVLLDSLNRKKEATDLYNKALNVWPDNALALNNLAYITAEGGANLDQAQTYAERAKKLRPNSADISDTLGYVYLQKNLNTQAAEIFRQNVAAHPDNAAFRFHLAMALLKQGDKQGAKDQASKALQSANPDLQNKIRTFVGQIG